MLVCREASPDRLPIGEKPIILGRAPDCNMVIVHQHVSKRHCAIQRTDEGIIITDLRSTNGTFMKGQRLPADVPTPWPADVTIHIGPFTLSLDTGKPQT
jgi:pSer/pThr/pTyr-binding forkhead associated (FHA) protein